jgi:hypothetical protein
MKLGILVLILFSCTIGDTQFITFKEIRFRPNPKFFKVKDSTITYPVVFTKNPVVDKKINDEIKAQILDIQDSRTSAAKVLSERINEGLINLFYEVSFKKNDILSISITSQRCGAYCSSYDSYFNFDIKTGKPIGISSIVDEDKWIA